MNTQTLTGTPDSFISHDILQSLIERRQKIRQLADFYLSELSKIESAYKILADDSDSENHSYKRIKWTNETLNCLALKNMPLKTVDILEAIFLNTPEELNSPERRRIYVTGLSVALNNLVSKKKVIKIKIPGEKGCFYGLPEWFDLDGITLKKQYAEVLQIRMNKNL